MHTRDSDFCSIFATSHIFESFYSFQKFPSEFTLSASCEVFISKPVYQHIQLKNKIINALSDNVVDGYLINCSFMHIISILQNFEEPYICTEALNNIHKLLSDTNYYNYHCWRKDFDNFSSHKCFQYFNFKTFLVNNYPHTFIMRNNFLYLSDSATIKEVNSALTSYSQYLIDSKERLRAESSLSKKVSLTYFYSSQKYISTFINESRKYEKES